MNNNSLWLPAVTVAPFQGHGPFSSPRFPQYCISHNGEQVAVFTLALGFRFGSLLIFGLPAAKPSVTIERAPGAKD